MPSYKTKRKNAGPGVSAAQLLYPFVRVGHVAVALFAVAMALDAALVLLPLMVPGVAAFEIGVWHVMGWTFGMWTYSVVRRPAGGPRWSKHWPAVLGSVTGRGFWLCAVGRLSLWLVLASVAIAGPTIAAVVYGLWPIGWSLALRRSTRAVTGEDRYRQVGGRTAAASMVACAGAMLTVLAQPAAVRSDLMLLAAGVVIALAALSVDGFNGLGMALGIGAARRSGLGGSSADVEVWFTVAVAVMVGVVASCATAAVVAVSVGVSASAADVGICVLFGMLTAVVSVLSRWALFLTDNSMLTIVGCATPAASVAYLALLGMLGDLNVGLLGVGTTAVVVAGAVVVCSASQAGPGTLPITVTASAARRRGRCGTGRFARRSTERM